MVLQLGVSSIIHAGGVRGWDPIIRAEGAALVVCVALRESGSPPRREHLSQLAADVLKVVLARL
jgi:hypothetical protein